MTEEEFLRQVAPYLSRDPRAVRTAEEDCAVWKEPGGAFLLFTADALVEGVHFKRAYFSPYALGRKLSAVNLSDIAAMGGAPEGALLVLGFSQEPEKEFVDQFYKGLTEELSRFGAGLLGGDTVKSPVLWAALFLFGRAEQPVFRQGARPGDLIFVSRPLGASAAALRWFSERKEPPEALKKAHLFPEPEVELGRFLAQNGLATAMIDVSDGLLLDLHRLCRASGVGAELYEIPIAEGATEKEALAGGEDYALLFTVPQEKAKALKEFSEKRPLFHLGRILPSPERLLYRGRPLAPQGFDHFKKGAGRGR